MVTAPRVADTLASDEWAARLRATLNEDSAWSRAARWCSARIELRHDTGSMVLNVADGEASEIATQPSPHGSDVIIAASDEAWSRMLAGKFDLLAGSGSGQVSLSGDLVFAMHHLRTLHFLLAAMRRLVGYALPQPSPDPPPPAAPVSGRYLDIDGVRTYVEEAGSGIPLLCLHAAGQDTLMYRHVLDGLADRFRVVAPDAPGHGKSALPSRGCFTSISQHVEFNERMIEMLGLERPVIIGCSMAGNMVLEMGARRPDAYRAIVSCEGAAHTPTVDAFTLDMLDANGAILVEPFARSLTGTEPPPIEPRRSYGRSPARPRRSSKPT